ncbi:Fe-S type, tartrate/fumarate subfamily hydro-lyase subunit alpha [Thermincola ferriacetica]|uniref:Fe-S type, tartrate/fumarate subfamily hydro-lyase subunit alpha n=1 Tax=Thermincola ferriacetica TaxID=281456 RepID=A0A0L6W5P7_9FIRM|nr:Fe-S type, tartrate/fumarate subfamily hydro-lyase subunit alpha [Thermincola ferriacetica]
MQGVFAIRYIETDTITNVVAKLCIEANYYLPEDVLQAIQTFKEKEISEIGRDILAQLIQNQEIARAQKVPICQDTGMAVVFVELGQDVHINGDLYQALNDGVAKGYKEGYLRKSIVADPFLRANTGSNTPAVIHIKLVPGDKLKITVAPKGGGSENMSAVKMLKPADGMEGVEDFILKTVEEAGPNPCPPIVIGVGIGGTMEKAALLAKEALLRPLGSRSPHQHIAAMEERLLEKINKLGIGPQGFGGSVTALGVNIEVFPCHIASLPVAVNINCHVSRHMSAEI